MAAEGASRCGYRNLVTCAHQYYHFGAQIRWLCLGSVDKIICTEMVKITQVPVSPLLIKHAA
jgi:hypothetical protein